MNENLNVEQAAKLAAMGDVKFDEQGNPIVSGAEASEAEKQTFVQTEETVN